MASRPPFFEPKARRKKHGGLETTPTRKLSRDESNSIRHPIEPHGLERLLGPEILVEVPVEETGDPRVGDSSRIHFWCRLDWAGYCLVLLGLIGLQLKP